MCMQAVLLFLSCVLFEGRKEGRGVLFLQRLTASCGPYWHSLASCFHQFARLEQGVNVGGLRDAIGVKFERRIFHKTIKYMNG